MDEATLAALVHAGRLLGTFKLILTSTHFLWFYDYFLTLGDEIKYAWRGKKSWMFGLFLANRYIPLIYLIWINTTFFGYNERVYVSLAFCEKTKWIPVFHILVTTFLAQTAVALRVYVVTGKNKRFGGLLLLLISVQFSFEVCFLTRSILKPMEALPDIDLDPFKACIYQRWKFAELSVTNAAISFDLVAFSLIFVTARAALPKAGRYTGIPSILGVIVRDATLYFIVMFLCQLLLESFLLFAPEDIQLAPGVVNTVFVPMLASRLLLSLKRAAAEPFGEWSLSTMTNRDRGATAELVTIQFASRPLNGSREASEPATIPPDEGEIELEFIDIHRVNR